MARRSVATLAAAVVVAAAVGVAQPAAAAGQVLVSDAFTGATTTSPIVALTSTPGFPCLTGGANTSATPAPGCNVVLPPSLGPALRFTNQTSDQLSAIMYNSTFPLSQGLQVEFKMYQYRPAGNSTNSGDGMLFALAVAPPPPGTLGPGGGYLGYGTNGGTSGPGLPAGYLGVGLDTYGDFADRTLEDPSCPSRPTGQVPNAASVRGPGNGLTGYCLLSTSGADSMSFFAGGQNSETGVQIIIDPDAGTYAVNIDADNDGSYELAATSGPLPSSYYDQGGTLHSGRPDQVTFLIAGATGFYNETTEITNLSAVTLHAPAPSPGESGNPGGTAGGAGVPNGTDVNPGGGSGSAGSNDPNPNTNPNLHVEGDETGAADATATAAQPTVTAPCSGACTLGAQTQDTTFTVTATDTSYHGTSASRAPTFALSIDGGSQPRCPHYRTADRDWVQFGFRGNAGSTFQKEARMTTRRALGRAEAKRLLATRQLCFAAPYRFATRHGYPLGGGQGEFAGVLADCARGVRGPCVTSRAVVRVGFGWGVRIVFVVPPNKRDPKALG